MEIDDQRFLENASFLPSYLWFHHLKWPAPMNACFSTILPAWTVYKRQAQIKNILNLNETKVSVFSPTNWSYVVPIPYLKLKLRIILLLLLLQFLELCRSTLLPTSSDDILLGEILRWFVGFVDVFFHDSKAGNSLMRKTPLSMLLHLEISQTLGLLILLDFFLLLFICSLGSESFSLVEDSSAFWASSYTFNRDTKFECQWK